MINVTDNAKNEALKLMEADNMGAKAFIRVGVKGGGCSGMSYELFGEAPEDVQDIDTVIPNEGFNVVIDQKSIIYLKGMELDYDDGLQGKGFVFKNPLATSTCGYGESFSVT